MQLSNGTIPPFIEKNGVSEIGLPADLVTL